MRPVTILRWGVLIIGLAHVWQAMTIGSNWSILSEYATTIPTGLRLLLAWIWVAVWGWWWFDLRHPSRRALIGIPVTFVVYTAVRIGLSRFSASIPLQTGWPATLFWGLIGIGFSLWALRSHFPNRPTIDSNGQTNN